MTTSERHRDRSGREAVLHIGASKTGTSALQHGLLDSVPQLAEQGVGVPLPSRQRNVGRLLRPLGWETTRGFVHPVDENRLAWLTSRLAATPGDRLLITCEDLCEAPEAQVRALLGVLDAAGLRPTVVLTVRSLAAVVPSEWQQFLKHRLTVDYPTFLEQLRDRRGPYAEHFWQRQDALAITRRWSERVGVDRVRVVVTPDLARAPDGLYEMFGAILGYDPTSLSWPTHRVNTAWGYTEAEVYRRINVALGRRLADYDRDYHPAVRGPLVKGVLARGASARITLPPEHLGWVRAEAERIRDGLVAAGHRIDGDVEALVPGPEAARPLPDLDETALAQAAVEALANLCVFDHKRHRSPRRTPPSATDGPGPGPVGALRRVGRRAVRRLGRSREDRPQSL